MRRILTLGAGVLMTAAVVLGAAGCRMEEQPAPAEEILGVDTSRGTVTASLEDHGAFGDGITVLELRFSDESCLRDIQESGAWLPLPLTEQLTLLVENIANLAEGVEASEPPPVLRNGAGTPRPLAVENGFYCFVDRHGESRNRKDDSQLWSHYSINCTLAVYDADAGILYYMELDT